MLALLNLKWKIAVLIVLGLLTQWTFASLQSPSITPVSVLHHALATGEVSASPTCQEHDMSQAGQGHEACFNCLACAALPAMLTAHLVTEIAKHTGIPYRAELPPQVVLDGLLRPPKNHNA